VFLAKMLGAESLACASSTDKLQRLTEFGADHVVNYATHDFVTEIYRLYGKPHRRSYDGGVDVVINYTGVTPGSNRSNVYGVVDACSPAVRRPVSIPPRTCATFGPLNCTFLVPMAGPAPIWKRSSNLCKTAYSHR